VDMAERIGVSKMTIVNWNSNGGVEYFGGGKRHCFSIR